MVDPDRDLSIALGAASRVRLRATNLTANAATLYGWIDANRDGAFDDETERASTAVPPGSDSALFSLAFAAATTGAPPNASAETSAHAAAVDVAFGGGDLSTPWLSGADAVRPSRRTWRPRMRS